MDQIYYCRKLHQKLMCFEVSEPEFNTICEIELQIYGLVDLDFFDRF